MRRGPAVFLLFCLLFGSAYGAWRAGWEALNRLSRHTPPQLDAALPTAGTTPLANRLVLVMVEGLRTEDAHLLPSLDWLRQQGAYYRLAIPSPGHQPVAAATLLTGAPPAVHTSITGRQIPADNLLQAAGRAKVTTGGAGSPLLGKLIAASTGEWYEAASPADLAPGIQALLKPGGPRLAVIHLEDLAQALQTTATGGGQADRQDALARLDVRLVAILDQIDWKSTAVLVTGIAPMDGQGQRSEGTPVPLLMAGSGVQPGARGEGSLLDVAPTAAALLGLPHPLAVRGRPLLPALRAEGRPVDAIMLSYLTTRRAQAASILNGFESSLAPPEPPATAAEADGYLAGLDRLVSAARQQWIRDGLVARLPCIGGGALVLLIYLLAVYRLHFGGAALAGHLLYLLSFHLLFFAAGGRYGWAIAGLDGPPSRLLLRYGLASGAAMLAASAVAGLVLSRKEIKRTRYLVAGALHHCLSLAALLALPAGGAVLFTGWEFPVELPPAGLIIWFFLTVMQVMLIGLLSPVWAWVTVRIARFVRHRWPPREIGDPEENADKVVRLRAIRRSSRRGARA